MKRLSVLIALAVLVGTTGSAEAQAQKKKKKPQPGQALKLTGQVVKVEKDANSSAKELGTITVKTLGTKDGEAVETVVKVTSDTTLASVPEPKKKGGGIQATSPAAFEVLNKGDRVIVHTRAGPGNQAAWIEVITPKKKNVLE